MHVLGVKRRDRNTDLSPAIVEVRNMGVYTFTHPYIFMEYCLNNYARPGGKADRALI
jgi:hypothetical protein